MSDNTSGGEAHPSHDAYLSVTDASRRLGHKLISWTWTDGRRTLTEGEHAALERVIPTAEELVDLSELDGGTEIAHIWMDGEEIDRVEWNDELIDGDVDCPTNEATQDTEEDR